MINWDLSGRFFCRIFRQKSGFVGMKGGKTVSELKGAEYIRFESIKHLRDDGSEYWSARELASALEYTKWENFHKVIKRAMIACENAAHSVLDDFPEVRKIVEASGFA